MNGITQLLLDSSLDQVDFIQCSFSDNDDFNDLITAISNSKLKHFRLYDGSFNLTMMAKSLAKLLTKTNTSLEDVIVGGYKTNIFSPDFDEDVFGFIDCDVARVLVEAMAHNSGQNTPFLKVCIKEKCVADISYPRDKVVYICN